MWRKQLAVLLLLLGCGSAAAQNTTLKANALYYGMLIPNISVETKLSSHWTINGDFVISFWESINQRPFKGLQVIVEPRYYTKEAFNGFYVAPLLGYDSYTLSKWDHPWYHEQHGVGWMLGATIGYQMEIARRWNLDFYLGGGYHYGRYYGIDKRAGERYADWNTSAEWMPYKVGVTFAYKLGMGKKAK